MTPDVRRVYKCVCVCEGITLSVWLLLEYIVDQDLKEDEEKDDDVVTLLEERGAFHPACRTTPQHTDVPTNKQTNKR